ncbi:MAG: DUF898 family protein [Sulfitobacter sp.]
MSETIQGQYFGQGKPLFWLYLRTAALTVVTLGFYRFWAKTRMRKYIWSSVSGGDDSFEYTGTGLEKLLGFLVAIVVLAIYLGIVQMGLFFLGLNVFAGSTTGAPTLSQIGGIYLSLFAVVPLFLFAQYRARRYKMARTRWRGIRFGMENGAWGYAWRAILHYLLSAITLGIMLPRQTFFLEKYMVDRSWYGDAPFVQNGNWTALYRGMKHIGIAILILVGGGILAALINAPLLGVCAVVIGYVWALVGFVSYRVYAFNYLTAHKALEGQTKFVAEVQTQTVVYKMIVGSVLIFVSMAVLSLVVAFASGLGLSSLGNFQTGAASQVSVVNIVTFGAYYIALFLLAGGLSLVFVVQPILKHVISNVTVFHADNLQAIQQRAADEGADAEGFADALDVGGAI